MSAALAAETRKAAASVVVRVATVLIVLGILAMTVGMALAARSGNPQVIGKLGPLASEHGWAQLIGIASMISAPAGLLGFGVVLSWVIGREFGDGTVSGLFALPVSRGGIVLAKLVVFLGWSALTCLALTVGCLLAGLLLGYGVPGGDDADALARLLGVGLLTGLLAVPTGWAATLGRGLLPGIALAVVMLALGQILVVAGAGAWLPLAAPALWALTPRTVHPAQLALVPAVALLFAGLCWVSWQRLELDR